MDYKKISLSMLNLLRATFDLKEEVEKVKKIDAEIRRRKLNRIENNEDDKDELLNDLLLSEELKKIRRKNG